MSSRLLRSRRVVFVAWIVGTALALLQSAAVFAGGWGTPYPR